MVNQELLDSMVFELQEAEKILEELREDIAMGDDLGRDTSESKKALFAMEQERDRTIAVINKWQDIVDKRNKKATS